MKLSIYRSQQKYFQKNPIKVWAMQTLCRHRKKFKVCLNVNELINIAEKTKECIYCGTILKWERGKGRNPDGPSLDRKNNEEILKKSNIQVICCRCNARKSSVFHENLLKYGFLPR